MYIGCHLSVSGGFCRAIETARSIGADTFAYFTRNPRGSRAKARDPRDEEKARGMLREQGFGTLVAHGSYTMNLATADPEARSFAADTLAEDLVRMEAFPGHYYNFHPGSHVGQGLEAAYVYIAAALNRAITDDTHAIVLLETMTGKGTEVGGRFQDLRAILDRVTRRDRMGVCLDTCHVFDGGYDIVHDLDGVLAEFDRVVGLSYLKALHLNDSKNPMGSHKDRHACIGQGYIGLEAFRRIVTHPKLRDLPMILETPNELPGYAAEIAILRGGL